MLQDLHAFAGKALKLALMQPATLQQKLRSLLAFLNPQQTQQQDPMKPRQSGQLLPLHRLHATCMTYSLFRWCLNLHMHGLHAPFVHGGLHTDLVLLFHHPQPSMMPGTSLCSLLSAVSLSPGPFTYQQVQQAALRDHRWLMLNTDTLQQRLRRLQEHLQVWLST